MNVELQRDVNQIPSVPAVTQVVDSLEPHVVLVCSGEQNPEKFHGRQVQNMDTLLSCSRPPDYTLRKTFNGE